MCARAAQAAGGARRVAAWARPRGGDAACLLTRDPPPCRRPAPPTRRGLTQEGRGGSRRCVGPRDMDLQVVSRTFFQTLVVRGGDVFVARASSTSDTWPSVQAAAVEAVQTFRLPPAAA